MESKTTCGCEECASVASSHKDDGCRGCNARCRTRDREGLVIVEQLAKLRSAADVPDVVDVAEGLLAKAEELGCYDIAWRAWMGDSLDALRARGAGRAADPFVAVATDGNGATHVGVCLDKGADSVTLVVSDPSNPGATRAVSMPHDMVTPLASSRLDVVWDAYMRSKEVRPC